MQVIVNISDDGTITTEVEREPATMEAAPTVETLAVSGDALAAGASPFSVAEGTEATRELPAEAMDGIDGGAGPQP